MILFSTELDANVNEIIDKVITQCILMWLHVCQQDGHTMHFETAIEYAKEWLNQLMKKRLRLQQKNSEKFCHTQSVPEDIEIEIMTMDILFQKWKDVKLIEQSTNTPAESPNSFFRIGVSTKSEKTLENTEFLPSVYKKSIFDNPPSTIASGIKISITLARPNPKSSKNSFFQVCPLLLSIFATISGTDF